MAAASKSRSMVRLSLMKSDFTLNARLTTRLSLIKTLIVSYLKDLTMVLDRLI
jgi:hypothetical protein